MRPETEAALAAVDAGLDLMRRRAGADQITGKGGRDLVTATDVAVEDVVRAMLLARYPDWTVVGEERGGEDQIGDRPYWLVDPICGTRNFASGLPLYCVNVALVEGGDVTVAAVGDGGTVARYYAERGQGAYRLAADGPTRLRATDASRVLNLSPGSGKPGSAPHPGARFARAVLEVDRWDVRVIGTTAAFVYLATGGIAGDILFTLSSPVHSAAGCLLCEEAGVRITDHQGQPWTLQTRQLLAAATPELHQDLLSLLTSAASAD